MLDWPTLVKCHAIVPVYYWPVLWLYLARLEATAKMCRAEGRRGFAWHLERNGTIWISHMDASDAERRQRGELPADFDRTPWTRCTTLEFGALAHLFGALVPPGRALPMPDMPASGLHGLNACLPAWPQPP